MVVRVATYNAALNRPYAGALRQVLTCFDKLNPHTWDKQAMAVALVIRHVRPDILLLNEFDYDESGESLAAFCEHYLENPNLPQAKLAPPIYYPERFSAPVNTGLPSGRDFDKDGVASDKGADALGFGAFPGQYGMLVLSQYPVLKASFRSFQHFLWAQMPNAKLPQKSEKQGGGSWFDQGDLAKLPLSSKSHWDLPVQLDEGVLHLLCSHPTPPVFDGDEKRNACRNHDEIRFWRDYVQGERYMLDDKGGIGGLTQGDEFLVLGDLNASLKEGDAMSQSLQQLLDTLAIEQTQLPTSEGAVEHSPHLPYAKWHTASWRLNADYVLYPRTPDRKYLVQKQGVFWPESSSLMAKSVKLASDHRLVFVDLKSK